MVILDVFNSSNTKKKLKGFVFDFLHISVKLRVENTTSIFHHVYKKIKCKYTLIHCK